MVKIGDSNIDFDGLLIHGPMGIQSVEPKVMRVLRVLTDNAGEVMTREDLITAVWGVEYGGDERLSRSISILRKALGDKRGQHQHIVTISRVGYRLIAEVSWDAPPSPPSLPHIAALKPEQSTNAQSTTTDTATASPPTAILKKPAIMALCMFIMAVVVSAFIFTDREPSGQFSLQAKMDTGFSHIENFAHNGAIQEAQDIFSQILSDNPGHAAARAGLAFAIFREYTHLERDPALLQRATSHAEAALRANEHLALANIAAAWAAEFNGNLDRAHEYLDRADILETNNTLALEGRYRTYGKMGEIEKSETIINKAIDKYPNKALFYSYRGYLHERKNDRKSSESDFRKAIELSPNNSRTYAQLAHSLHMQNRTGEAVDVIQQGLNIDESTLLYNNLGTYLFFQGQYGLAASAFEKTLELSGDSHEHLYWANLGDAYRWSQNNKDEAATAYRRAIQLLQVDLERYPNDENLISRAAMVNAKLGNLDKAQTYMDSFELTPKSSATQLYRAVVTHEIMSHRDKALEYLSAAIKSNYPMIEIFNDPELARLRQDPEYHRLLAKLKPN